MRLFNVHYICKETDKIIKNNNNFSIDLNLNLN